MDESHSILFKSNYNEGNNHTKMLKIFFDIIIASFHTILVFLVKIFGQKLKFTFFITIDLLLVRIFTFNFLDARRYFMVKNWSYKKTVLFYL